jgi:hypothetical protein
MAMLGGTNLRAQSGRGIEIAARAGYLAKGVVYCVVGTLALLFVFHEAGGQLTGGEGAIRKLGAQPLGDALLWATAAGLLCYAIWSVLRAVLNPEHKRHLKGGLSRVGYVLAGVSHASLAVYAAQIAHGTASSGGGTETWIGKLMAMPFGRMAVALSGLIAVGFGIVQLYRAVKDKPEAKLDFSRMSANEQRIAHAVARLGETARGIVFAVIGISLVVAAVRVNPSEASDLGEALRELASGPFGEVLLPLVAAGLFAYGVHQFFLARYISLSGS